MQRTASIRVRTGSLTFIVVFLFGFSPCELGGRESLDGGSRAEKRDEEIRCSREEAAVALRSDAVGLFVVVVF